MGLPDPDRPREPRSNWGKSDPSFGRSGMRSVPIPGRTFMPRLLRLEVQRHAIDAITQMCRRRPVLEHVAEMAAAAAAVHFRARHAEAAVGRGLDRARNRIVEARPAGAALELGLGDEQRLLTAGAGERAGTLLVVEGAAAGRFRAVPAHDRVLPRREEAAPFLVGAGYRI